MVRPFVDVDDNELSDDQIVEKYYPLFIGPSWRRDGRGEWDLPKWTLGWEIAAWCARNLNSLDDDAPEGTGFRFTMEQFRFVLHWYAVDELGEFVYRRSVLQRMKGWGKDPLLAVLAIVEFVGPCRFGGWGKNGLPVARLQSRSLVQVAAVSKEQTNNTMDLIPSLMTDGLRRAQGIKDGIEFVRASGGRRLMGVTSNYRTLEGKRSTFIVLNETHHWVSGNQGQKMYETVTNNTAKMKGRFIAITNAYLPGEDSVAEKMRLDFELKSDQFEKGLIEDPRFLYDSIEAPSTTPLTDRVLRLVLPLVRGDALWLDLDFIIASIRDSAISVSRSRRMWLNQIEADDDALYDSGTWDALGVASSLVRGDEIVLGFDGGKSDDATVLVAIRVRDALIVPLLVIEKPEGADDEWEVDRDEVSSAVHGAFRTYDVAGFYCDVALWESEILEWQRLYGSRVRVDSNMKTGHPFWWDMRRSLQVVTLAHERFASSIFNGAVRHGGDKSLRRHVLNVYRSENRYGVSFRKISRESNRKVDLYAAAMVAHECLIDYRARGRKRQGGRRSWFM